MQLKLNTEPGYFGTEFSTKYLEIPSKIKHNLAMLLFCVKNFFINHSGANNFFLSVYILLG